MPEPFARFARRLTLSYVILAVLLIALVVAATSILAFLLYVGALNESIGVYATRLTAQAAPYERRHEPLSAYAAALVNEIGGARVRVIAYDDAHRVLAASGSRSPMTGGRFTRGAAALFGLHSAIVHAAGGTIVVAPDFAGFARLLSRYLTFVLPIGALAVLGAWLIGRAITRRAIAPLRAVAAALHRVAAGDLSPQPLLTQESALPELTAAYNEVAHRLTLATAERERNESQMRQFIADAGHELRTPLTIVMGYLDLLQQGAVTDADGIASIQATMLAESRHMRASIDKLILLARLERPAVPRTELVDATTIVRRTINALEPLAGEGRIVFTSTPEPATVEADGTELYEAVKNVIENAIRYAPESVIHVEIASRATNIEIMVSDRGPGMNAQDLEHAFDRFYRGSSRTNGEGSGLGLAIAKRAIERISGTIALESRTGKGTRVTISLPMVQRSVTLASE